MSKQKKKGTEFETKCVKILKQLGYTAERHHLSGGKDEGDVIAVSPANDVYVIECKDYKKFTPKKLREWFDQADAECRHYMATHDQPATAALMVSIPGTSMVLAYGVDKYKDGYDVLW
jgi:hypothetical protein